MLNWVVIFLIISIIAAVFGFTGIAVASAGIAKIIFYIFALAFLISLFMSIANGNNPRPKI